jgi:hypothetical protein
VERARHIERRGPTFLCVGPEKTGTSWIWANLKPHPDVYLPPIKEIRYFYENVRYPGEGLRGRFSPRGDWHSRDYRDYAAQLFRRTARRPVALVRDADRIRWEARYLFGSRSDAWYLSLFDEAAGRPSGDVSPQYFTLPHTELAHVRELLPDVRVLILLRDPIDWSWSFARMSLIKERAPEDVSAEEYRAFWDNYAPCYPTVEEIGRWRAHFEPEQLFFGFYDRLCEAPAEFYADVCRFVGVDPARLPEAHRHRIFERINKGRDMGMPHRLAVELARTWRGEVERLGAEFAPYPQRWLRRYDDLLARETERPT